MVSLNGALYFFATDSTNQHALWKSNGTPAGTTRGFAEAEFRLIAQWIVEVVDGLAANGEDGNAEVEAGVKAKVEALCAKFPLYPGL